MSSGAQVREADARLLDTRTQMLEEGRGVVVFTRRFLEEEQLNLERFGICNVNPNLAFSR